jgi:hypothetical protein
MATTSNYAFTKLSGTDIAGYSSINVCLDSVDSVLTDLTVKDNSMILVDVPSAATPATYMSGYTIKSSALTSTQYSTNMGLNAPTGSYYWYRKN